MRLLLDHRAGLLEMLPACCGALQGEGLGEELSVVFPLAFTTTVVVSCAAGKKRQRGQHETCCVLFFLFFVL